MIPSEIYSLRGPDLLDFIQNNRVAAKVIITKGTYNGTEVLFCRGSNGLVLLPGGKIEPSDYYDWEKTIKNEVGGPPPDFGELALIALSRELGEELSRMFEDRTALYVDRALDSSTTIFVDWEYKGQKAVDLVHVMSLNESEVAEAFPLLQASGEIVELFWMNPAKALEQFPQTEMPDNIREAMTQFLDIGT